MNSFTRKALFVLLTIAVIAGGGWFGRKTYKRAIERRLIAQAKQHLVKKGRRDAVLCLRRALQVNPLSVESMRLMASLLEAGGSPLAVGWRVRAAQLKPEEMEYRLEWAETAIKLQDYNSASDALKGINEKCQTTAP